MQSAFSSGSSRVGQPVDLCLQLLDCEQVGTRYRSRLLTQANVTTRDFYDYQVSGAVSGALMLYGRIDPDKLLAATNALEHECAARVRDAASKLEALRIHGGILADNVGLGKTIQCMLLAWLHAVLWEGPTYGPILLTVPPSLVVGWILEIKNHWPAFTLVISYEDHVFKDVMADRSISYLGMRNYPNLDYLPAGIKYVWDKKNARSIWAIILSSYETHKMRTGKKERIIIPGERYANAQRDPETGKLLWKRKPKVKWVWVALHKGVYTLWIGDEAQKVKNINTGLWAVMFNQCVQKSWFATATPIYNGIRVS